MEESLLCSHGECGVQNMGSVINQGWILARPHLSGVALSKTLDPSEPRVLHLWHGNDNWNITVES